MANQQVQVILSFDAEGGPHLDVETQVITLAQGDTVEWIFQNIPSGCLAYIYFRDPQNPDDPSSNPFGPFQSLDPSATGVIGIGNIGSTGSFPYVAMILNQDGPVAISEPTTRIDNTSDQQDTSPDARILYIPNPINPENPTVKVTPPNLTVEQGKSAAWRIEELPPDLFVTFHFDNFLSPMTGPFQSFSISRGFDGVPIAIGAGFATSLESSQLPPQFLYHVRVRNSLGTVIAGDDPVIEPLGDPPGSGGQ